MDADSALIVLACEAGYVRVPVAARRLELSVSDFLRLRREMLCRALVLLRLPTLAAVRTSAELTYQGEKIERRPRPDSFCILMSTASLSSQLFVSVKEGSALCGLSEQVIRRLLSDGRIRGHRPSGTRRILVDRQSLLDYVTGGRPTPAA